MVQNFLTTISLKKSNFGPPVSLSASTENKNARKCSQPVFCLTPFMLLAIATVLTEQKPFHLAGYFPT